MAKNAFSYTNGRWEIDKDPDDIWYYGVDIADALTAAGATIATAAEAAALGRAALSATPGGVELEALVFAQGSRVMVMVKGGAAALGVEGNYVRFRIPLSTGEQTDRTIYFNITEN